MILLCRAVSLSLEDPQLMFMELLERLILKEDFNFVYTLDILLTS